jgi:hypothetical protein
MYERGRDKYLFHNLISSAAVPFLSKTLIDFVSVLHAKCSVAAQGSVVRPSTYSSSENTGRILIKFGTESL